MSSKGYIKLWRAIQDSDLYFSEPFTRSAAWIDLLLLANYKDNTAVVNGSYIEVKTATVLASRRFLEKRWGWSGTKVEKFLIYLASGKEPCISYQKSKISSTVTILNWGKYQGNATEEEPQKNHKKTTKEPQTDHGRTTEEPQENQLQEIQEIQEVQEENISVLASPRDEDQQAHKRTRSPNIPHKEMQDYWNDRCEESGLMRSAAWPADLIRARWRDQWFRDNWGFIFRAAHANKWCRENHIGIKHVLRPGNARNYYDEVAENHYKLEKQGYTYNREEGRWYLNGKVVTG